MLANAVYQAMAMALTDRVRGQARSYSGFVSSPSFASDATSVGAGLLANGVSQLTSMLRLNRFASKPAPTGDILCRQRRARAEARR